MPDWSLIAQQGPYPPDTPKAGLLRVIVSSKDIDYGVDPFFKPHASRLVAGLHVCLVRLWSVLFPFFLVLQSNRDSFTDSLEMLVTEQPGCSALWASLYVLRRPSLFGMAGAQLCPSQSHRQRDHTSKKQRFCWPAHESRLPDAGTSYTRNSRSRMQFLCHASGKYPIGLT
jgi:hypothetical protein